MELSIERVGCIKLHGFNLFVCLCVMCLWRQQPPYNINKIIFVVGVIIYLPSSRHRSSSFLPTQQYLCLRQNIRQIRAKIYQMYTQYHQRSCYTWTMRIRWPSHSCKFEFIKFLVSNMFHSFISHVDRFLFSTSWMKHSSRNEFWFLQWNWAVNLPSIWRWRHIMIFT